MKHRTVSYPIPRGRIGGVEKHLDFISLQMRDQWLVRPLGWNREDSTDLLDSGWNSVFDEAGEGLDCREARVPGRRRVASRHLEIFEERRDERRIQLIEREGRWWRLTLSGLR